LSILDIIIIVVLLLGAYSGYKKGLILEVISIVAFVLAIVGGFKLLHVGMEYIAKVYEGFGNLLPFVAFLVLFVLIIVVVNLIGTILKRIIDWTPLGIFDNVAGSLIGIVKSVLILSILIWLISGLNINIPGSFMDDSKLLPIVSGFSSRLSEFISTIFPSFDVFIKTMEDLFESFTS
jgi:membrane protein required for colicin V production